MKTPLSSIVSALALSSVATAQVPFTVTDANHSYTQSSVPTTITSTGGSANMLASGQDQLFAHAWYYRVSGDTREFPFNNSAVNVFASAPAGAGTQIMTWGNVEGRGLLSAAQKVQAFSDGPTQGHVLSTMTLTNLTATPIVIDLFAYADFDVCLTAGTDSATVGATEHVITDTACTRVCRFGGIGATGTEVTAFAVLRGKLLNAVVDNLLGVGSGAFGPGDYTGAFQWTLTIPTSGSVSAVAYLSEGIETLPSYDTYGTEGAGLPGIPTIARSGPAVQDPNAPVTFDVVLANGRPGFCFHLLALGRGSSTIAGIDINVNLALISTFKPVSAGGAATFSFTIPNVPDFRGLVLCHQYIVNDPAAGNGLASWTKGLETILGHL